MIPPAPNHPGLRDLADWKLVVSVPDTAGAAPNGQQWASLLRLFSWQVARQSELEERILALESTYVPAPVIGIPSGPPAL